MRAALELYNAVAAALMADPALVAALGGARLHEPPAPPGAPPYVTFGRASVFDHSASAAPTQDHVLTLRVFAAGRRAALALAELVRLALDDRDLAMDGVRLVLLRFEALDLAAEPEARATRATLRFRAVTETG